MGWRRKRGRVLGELVVVASFGFGCGADATPRGPSALILVEDEPDPDALDERLVAEAEAYLERIVPGDVVIRPLDGQGWDALEAAASDEAAGLVLVLDADVLVPETVSRERLEALGTSGFVLEAVDRGNWRNALGDRGATFVLAAGTERLGRQYALYEALRRFGVRFFHPEEEFVPEHAAGDLRPLARRLTIVQREADARPDFAWRSWSFHSSHPLEHLEAFSDGDHPFDEALAVEAWIVKNKGNRFKGLGRGVASASARARRAAELEELRVQWGFPRGTGLTLHNEQQGASAEIDRDSDVPVREQIERIVQAKLGEVPDTAWFSIHFGPTEFTTTPDVETVNWIDWAGTKALELRPDLEVEVNVHITGSQPSSNFDDLGCPPGTHEDGRADYYDLAFHTDPRLGLQVHTVMFYPLEGPARVYNQESFAHKLCLMERASAQGRPLTWFPEGSWWLSFDNPIPVYLPLYMWARARDVELVEPLLASRGGGTVRGHRMFNSGQEWGYWQQDYVVGLMAWNADVSLEQALGEIFDPLCAPADWEQGCAAKDTAIAVLEAMMEHQREFFLNREDVRGHPGGLYAYFAGEDQADVIASVSGFEFRPVRVSFAEVLAWNDDELARFRATDLAALAQADALYSGWHAELEAIRSEVPEAGLRWLDEVLDGVEINALRARHTHALYDAVVSYREAERAGNADPASKARDAWAIAEDTLATARQVVARREASYRYPPEQTHGGGLTEDTAVDNGTTYPYRVHTKTHLLTYWTNRHDEVRRVLDGEGAGASSSVVIEDAIAEPGEALQVRWPPAVSSESSVSIGSLGTIGPDDSRFELPPEPGSWRVEGAVVAESRMVDVVGAVARSSLRAATPAQGITLTQPSDPAAQTVLASVFPGLEWAWLASPDAIVLGIDGDEDGVTSFEAVEVASIASGDASGFVSEPIAFDIPVATSSGGAPLGVGLEGAVLRGSVVDGTLADPVEIEGRISVQDLVAALIELAGFDEQGALATLSGILGFDPADPPSTVPFAARLTIEPPT